MAPSFLPLWLAWSSNTTLPNKPLPESALTAGKHFVSRSEANAVAVPGDLVELGRVTDAYGLQGWVKIQPYSADSSALLHARQWWLRRSHTPLQHAGRKGDLEVPWPVKVLKSRTQGSSIVGSLQGVVDRTEAERLRGCTVWVSRAAFPALEDDEYYWVDLIG